MISSLEWMLRSVCKVMSVQYQVIQHKWASVTHDSGAFDAAAANEAHLRRRSAEVIDQPTAKDTCVVRFKLGPQLRCIGFRRIEPAATDMSCHQSKQTIRMILIATAVAAPDVAAIRSSQPAEQRRGCTVNSDLVATLRRQNQRSGVRQHLS